MQTSYDSISDGAEPTKSGYSVIVPVYRSQETLRDLTNQLLAVFQATNQSFEIIYVNDCSPDASGQIVDNLSHEFAEVRAFHLMTNFGQHNALLCGIRNARYSICITLDDDLQHPPTEIPKLISEMNHSSADVVYGCPNTEDHGLLRDMASISIKLALKTVLGIGIARKVSAFRLFKTELRRAFRNYDSPYVSIDVLLSWGANEYTSVVVKHEPRHLGTSGYSIVKLMAHALNMITGFSTLPLRLASLAGLATSLFGFSIMVFVLFKFLLEGSPVEGFTFLAATISILSGVQLLAVGIIGEYLARMFLRTQRRPAYVVKVPAPLSTQHDDN